MINRYNIGIKPTINGAGFIDGLITNKPVHALDPNGKWCMFVDLIKVLSEIKDDAEEFKDYATKTFLNATKQKDETIEKLELELKQLKENQYGAN